MRKTRILAWILAISIIGVSIMKNVVSADNWIEYNPDANVQCILNEGFTTEQNFVAGTITISDGTKSITILDRNLGATMTGGGKNAPVVSYGNYYQWGNNYGFPSDSDATITTSSDKVDTSDYGPDNPYLDSIFIKGSATYDSPLSNWSSVHNDNLRGGTGDDETNGRGLNSDNPITDRQGPCPDGYHIPSIGELDELAVMWYNNKYNDNVSTGYLIEEVSLQQEDVKVSADFSEDLLIPFSSLRSLMDGKVDTDYAGLLGNLRSSSPYSEYGFTFSLTILNGKSGILKYALYADVGNYRSDALPIRCFKDENETPSKTLALNIMSGENIISTGINFSDETPTSGQVLDAIDWLSTEIGLATGYHFQWYIDDAGVETGFDLDTAIASGTITSSLALTGKVEPNKYTISFLDEDGTEIMSGEFTYDQESSLPVNTTTKQGYTFKGWKDGQGNIYSDGATIKNLTIENGTVLEFTPIWEKISQPSAGGAGGSSGGGHSSHTAKPNPEVQENTHGSGDEIGHGSAELQNGYSQEMNDAYQFAYEHGITTMDSIQKADMEGGLTRIAMAKMLAYYAINILSMKPDETRVNKFKDVTDKLSSQYDNGVDLAYQLGIMGINMPNNRFRPFDLVTRAEFGTALSRMLYKLADGDRVYYSTHLKKLKEEKIINNDNPSLRELRGYVMIMLMRTTMTGENLQHYLQGTGFSDYENNLTSQEVERYFTEAYGMGKIYYKIGDLQRLLKYLGFYNGKINNTYDKNTVNAVYDFQVAMGILDISDTKNPARGYLGPETRDVLNQKRAEFK